MYLLLLQLALSKGVLFKVFSGGYILKIDKTAGGDVAPNEPLAYYENNWDDDARYSETLGFRSQYDIFGNILTNEPFGPPNHSRLHVRKKVFRWHPLAFELGGVR